MWRLIRPTVGGTRCTVIRRAVNCPSCICKGWRSSWTTRP